MVELFAFAFYPFRPCREPFELATGVVSERLFFGCDFIGGNCVEDELKFVGRESFSREVKIGCSRSGNRSECCNIEDGYVFVLRRFVGSVEIVIFLRTTFGFPDWCTVDGKFDVDHCIAILFHAITCAT